MICRWQGGDNFLMNRVDYSLATLLLNEFLNEQRIQQRDDINILGVRFKSNFSQNEHIEYRIIYFPYFKCYSIAFSFRFHLL